MTRSPSGFSGAAAIAAGQFHTCALFNGGTVRCSGDSGVRERSLSPVEVAGISLDDLRRSVAGVGGGPEADGEDPGSGCGGSALHRGVAVEPDLAAAARARLPGGSERLADPGGGAGEVVGASLV